MPTNIGSISNYFPYAFENSVPMTLTSTILAGATTVAVTGMTNYTNGQIVTFTVDPTTPSLKQVFTGTVNTGAGTVTNVIWTEIPTGGVNVSHSAGATIIDYVSATHWDMAMTGIGKSLNQNGTLITSAVTSALNITGGAAGGWTPTGFTPSVVAYNGNRSYSLTFSANDLTPTLSPGMRLQMTRTVTAPTQCTSLNGTTQYYSKTSPAGMTFTNNFVVSAWVKLSSYGTQSEIATRYNGTSGWYFDVNASGQVRLVGTNGGSGNFGLIASYQSIPLNKWVHIAAQLDLTSITNSPTVNYVMIDGVNVPAVFSQGGTNPTTIIQAGNLEIGSQNGGLLPWPGKIAQVAIYSAKVTQANILASISQGLAGTETSLVSAYSFNNTINDLNANANNLTANGSAVATNADTPFTQTSGLTGLAPGTTNYGIITPASFSTNTTLVVQVPEGDTIPTSGGVSAVSYATNKTPYGFPAQRGKWRIKALYRTSLLQSSPTSGNWYNLNTQLNIPIGEWVGKISGSLYHINTANANSVFATLSTANNTESDTEWTVRPAYLASGNNAVMGNVFRENDLSLAAATIYFLNFKTDSAAATQIQWGPSSEPTEIVMECAYI